MFHATWCAPTPINTKNSSSRPLDQLRRIGDAVVDRFEPAFVGRPGGEEGVGIDEVVVDLVGLDLRLDQRVVERADDRDLLDSVVLLQDVEDVLLAGVGDRTFWVADDDRQVATDLNRCRSAVAARSGTRVDGHGRAPASRRGADPAAGGEQRSSGQCRPVAEEAPPADRRACARPRVPLSCSHRSSPNGDARRTTPGCRDPTMEVMTCQLVGQSS